jgi:hypothetical protein
MPFPIARSEISKTEEELRLRFPPSFIDKMQLDNGGELTLEDEGWELIPFKNRSNNKLLIRTSNDISYELKKAREWSNFPEDCVPFAFNGAGDYLVFRKQKGEVLGNEIFFWFHETAELTKKAEDFKDLL